MEVLEMSVRRGISRQRATLIADAVVARLATADDGTAGDVPDHDAGSARAKGSAS
jgi:hypothetical protein